MHTHRKPHSERNVTRRDVLKALAVITGSAVLSQVEHNLSLPVARAAGSLFATPVYLPFVTKSPVSSLGKVVQVRSQKATSWNGESNYWEYVNQSVVNEMVDRGVIALTGAATITDAWRTLIPNYQPGQKIAIKVNFNNSWVCGNIAGVIDALVQPVNALVSRLEQIGVAHADVCVFDAVRAIPNRFVEAGLDGISYFDQICFNNAGFSDQPEAYVTFYPPVGMSMPPEKITDVLLNAAYLINMPIMKGGHPLGGVTLGFKNHFGTIHNCSALHDYMDAVRKPGGYNPDYNPMVDFFRNPHIGGKTVLTIGDALFAARDFNGPPEIWGTFDGQVPNSLFFATDPVAIDCVMHDFIAAELGEGLTPAANRYLVLAGRAGLGVYESVDPWVESYSQIKYQQVVF